MKWAAQSPIGHSSPPTKRQIFPLISIATNIAAFPSHGRFIDRLGTRRLLWYLSIFRPGWTDKFSPAIAIWPGYQIPLPAEFHPKMHPIKQSHRSVATTNPTTPEHKNIAYGVDVGLARRIRYSTQRLRRRAWVDEDVVYLFMT